MLLPPSILGGRFAISNLSTAAGPERGIKGNIVIVKVIFEVVLQSLEEKRCAVIGLDVE